MTSKWPCWRLKSPASRLFNQSFIQALIKVNIKAPRHWPLCGKFTGDRWISRTNGQLRGKFFHLMTSSCCFSNTFATIGSSLSISNHCRNEKSVSSYLKQQVVSSFDFKSTSNLDLDKIRLRTKTKYLCMTDYRQTLLRVYRVSCLVPGRSS